MSPPKVKSEQLRELRTRLARGEISATEFDRLRLEILREDSPSIAMTGDAAVDSGENETTEAISPGSTVPGPLEKEGTADGDSPEPSAQSPGPHDSASLPQPESPGTRRRIRLELLAVAICVVAALTAYILREITAEKRDPEPSTGELVVTVSPPAQIIVDGMKIKTDSRATFSDLDAGPHRVVVQKQGYHKEERRIHIRAGKTSRLDLTLKPKP